MKLKRWKALMCLVLALAFLTGCTASTALPDGMEKAAVIAAGQEVLDHLLAGEYEEVAASFREDIREQEGKQITADVIKELMDQYTDPEEVGQFKKIGSKAASGAGDSETERHAIAEFHCEYTEEKVGFGIAFDPDMNLIGLSIAGV